MKRVFRTRNRSVLVRGGGQNERRVKAGAAPRHRRLIVEPLEERRVMAAIARFDFDADPNEQLPTGWTHITAANAPAGAVDPSGIGIKFTGFAPTTSNAIYVAGTVPSDATGIKNGIGRAAASVNITFALTNLDPQKSYEVWVLGGNNAGSAQTQQVSVEGAQGATSLTQSIANLNLWVNSSVGDSSKAVTDFSPIFVQTPLHDDLDNDGTLDTYDIRVAVTQSLPSTIAEAAGVVIREFTPSPSFTLPSSGSPFTLLMSNGNRILKNSSGTVLAAFANTGAITISGTDAANDTLNIDLGSGNPLTGGVTFNGGAGASDKLSIIGGSQGTVTYNYTNAHDGSIVLSNFGTINYTGIESIVNTGMASDVIFNSPPTADTTFLEDNGNTPNDGMLRFRSLPIASGPTDFAIPTGSLTINLGGGNDTFTISAAPQFTAALTINGDAGDDTINLNADITFAANKSLDVDLTDDIALPGVEIINLGTDANLKLFGTGAAMLKASKNIALATRSSIEAVNGTITLSANQQNAPSGGDFVGIDLANNTLVRTSGSGNLLLQGRGGNDGTTGGHSGIRLQQSSRLETTGVGLATGQGLISLSGTGGNGNAGNDGVTINGCFGSAVCTTATGIFSSGDGSVQITGTGGDSISPAINLAFATIDTSLGTANVTLSLTGDSLNIADSATVSANNHLVGLLPRTFGFAINLGDSDNPSQLGLTDAELDRVTAGTINIGDANSGPITISAAIDRAAGSTTAINLTTGTNKSIEFSGSGSLDAKNGNVTLLTNSSGSGAITSGMAAIDVSGANLSLTAGSGGIGASGNPLVVSATNLNALTGGNGNQFLSASDSTTIDATGLSAETGTIELDAGLFTLGGSNRVNDSTKLNVNGATFALGANHETVDTLTLTSGSITGASGILTSTNTIQTKSGSISAILASANGLTQLTTGTTMLSGANTYSGDTTISAGTLKLSASNVIPDGSGKGNVVLNPASGTATLDLGGFSETVNGLSNSGAGSSVVNNSANGGPFTLTVGGNDQDSAFSGVIQNAAGTLALTKIGTGTLTLSGANTYRGNTTISGGTLKLGAANVIPDGTGTGNVVFNPAGGTATFDLNGFSETINGLSNSGAGTSIVDNSVSGGPFTLTLGANDQTSTFSGAMKNTAGTVALTKIGNGTLTLSGANTYSGDTTISVGTLKLGAANAIPGGPGKGNVVFNPSSGIASFDVAGFNERINGLASTGGGSSVIDNSVNGAPFLYIGGTGQSSNFGGTIQNTAGSLTVLKEGTGTLTLTGSSTHSDTIVSGGAPGTHGTLVVDGTLSGSVHTQGSGILRGTGTVGQLSTFGEIDPGGAAPNYDPGILNSADVSFLGGSFVVPLNGGVVGAQYSQLNVTGSVTINSGTSLNALLRFTPTLGDTFTIIKDTGGVTGTFNGLPEGEILSAVVGGANVDLQITYHGGTNNNDVVLTVTNVPPTLDAISDPAAILEEAGLQTINLSDISAGGTQSQTLTITATSSNPSLIPDPQVTYTSPNSVGSISYQPLPDQSGTAVITVTVKDNGGTASGSDTFSRSFTVQVTAVNDAPTGVNDSLSSVAEDSGLRTISFATLLGNDSKGPNESGQTLTITEVSGAVGGAVAISGSNVIFTPTGNYNGPASFTYTLRDDGTTNGFPDSKTSTATVSFTITEVNDAPSGANDPLASVAEDFGPRTIPFATLLGNDSTGPTNESGQTLTIISVSGAAGGSASISGTDVIFTPTDNYNGPAGFIYTLQDNGTTAGAANPKTSSAVASFIITEVNDAPSGVNDTLSSVAEDSGPRTILFATLLANDSKGPANESGQTLVITQVGGAMGGTVSISGSAVIFTPASDFNGAAAFTYTLRDDGTTNGVADFKTSTAVVSFLIDARNDPPSFTKGADQTATATSQSIIHWATAIVAGPPTATDEVGQHVSFAVSNDNNGMFSAQPAIDPVGKLTFTPKPNVAGTARVTVVLMDDGGTAGGGGNASGPQTFNIVVTKSHVWHNDAQPLDVTGPDGQPDGHIVAEDALAIINYINAFGAGAVPANAQIARPFGFLDTSGGINDVGDDFIAPADALAVINAINAGLGGEGESGDGASLPLNDLLSLLAIDVASQFKRRR